MAAAKLRSFEELVNLFSDYSAEQSGIERSKLLYEPVDYIMEQSGKKLRPLSMLLVHQALGGDVSDILPAAYAIELFHNFTLVHDDIMDKAELRRNKDTVHKRFGTELAILSGDVMMIDSVQYVRKAERNCNNGSAIDLFLKTAQEICIGQALDMRFERRNDVVKAEYIEMIRLKTAVLLACSMSIPAVLSRQDEQTVQLIYGFAEQLGIAFQIQDDYLDLYGDQSKVGKQSGGDILQAKKTILYFVALEYSDGDQKSRLNHLFSSDIQGELRLEQTKILFEELNVKDRVQQEIALSIKQCDKILERLIPITALHEVLVQLKEQVLQRDK
ncbi:MAG TPA: polyprenyl synthetase family protein [Saprospiraceae bacterium]|nr:polyprenyl synthetase family protein [Saprospiraceae bacterium]